MRFGFAGALAAVMVAGLGAAGFWFAADLVRFAAAGRAAVTDGDITLSVGGEALVVPARLIRFDDQRKPGDHPRLDLALAWPGLGPARLGPAGSDAAATTAPAPDPPIYVTLEPREGDLDSSSRLAAVYQRFFVGEPAEGPDGLVATRLSAASGYEGETLYYEPGAVRPFVTRCFGAAFGDQTSICLRERLFGRTLTATWRFNVALLAEWRKLDPALAALTDGFVVKPTAGEAQPKPEPPKDPLK